MANTILSIIIGLTVSAVLMILLSTDNTDELQVETEAVLCGLYTAILQETENGNCASDILIKLAQVEKDDPICK